MQGNVNLPSQDIIEYYIYVFKDKNAKTES